MGGVGLVADGHEGRVRRRSGVAERRSGARIVERPFEAGPVDVGPRRGQLRRRLQVEVERVARQARSTHGGSGSPAVRQAAARFRSTVSIVAAATSSAPARRSCSNAAAAPSGIGDFSPGLRLLFLRRRRVATTPITVPARIVLMPAPVVACQDGSSSRSASWELGTLGSAPCAGSTGSKSCGDAGTGDAAAGAGEPSCAALGGSAGLTRSSTSAVGAAVSASWAGGSATGIGRCSTHPGLMRSGSVSTSPSG